MRSYRSILTKWSVFLCACVLAGCSAIRLGYANGDTVMYWWLNSYVDFTNEQKPWVKADIDNFMAWHRKTQLNDYAQWFTQLQQRVQHKVTPEEVMDDYAATKKRIMLVVDKALPELTRLAMDLQPEQIAHLEKKFASNNEDYRKEYLRGSLEDRQLSVSRK
jgi:hypothetical protein